MAPEAVTLYVSFLALERDDVTPADVRSRDHPRTAEWTLSERATRRLEPLLLREGFDADRPIFVREPTGSPGFFLTQHVEGTSLT
jgi:hypothetical protein